MRFVSSMAKMTRSRTHSIYIYIVYLMKLFSDMLQIEKNISETYRRFTLVLNPMLSPNLRDNVAQSPHAKDKDDQTNHTQNMHAPELHSKNTTKCVGSNQ